MADRFGPLPRASQALIEVSRVRVFAEGAGVRRVESESERLICRLAQPGKSGEFLKTGARFPKTHGQRSAEEIDERSRKYLIRNQKSSA